MPCLQGSDLWSWVFLCRGTPGLLISMEVGYLGSWPSLGALTSPGLRARAADTPTLKLPLGKCWQLPLPGACRLGCHSPLKGSLFLTLLRPVVSRRAVLAPWGGDSIPFSFPAGTTLALIIMFHSQASAVLSSPQSGFLLVSGSC